MSESTETANLSSFGITSEEETEPIEDEEESNESESEEDEGEEPSLDASDEDEDIDDKDTDEEESDEDEESQYELSDEDSEERKKRIAAEKQRREFQGKYDSEKSRNDQMQQQFQQILVEFNKLKNQNEGNNEPAILGDDDDLVTVADLKKLKTESGDSEASKQIKQIQQAYALQESQKNQWIQSQPNFKDVQEFINENHLDKDQSITSIPTDSVGLYMVVQKTMLEKENAKLRAQNKKLSVGTNRKKGKVPPTTGKGSAKRAQGTNDAMGNMEKMLYNFGKKRGQDLSVKKVG